MRGGVCLDVEVLLDRHLREARECVFVSFSGSGMISWNKGERKNIFYAWVDVAFVAGTTPAFTLWGELCCLQSQCAFFLSFELFLSGWRGPCVGYSLSHASLDFRISGPPTLVV